MGKEIPKTEHFCSEKWEEKIPKNRTFLFWKMGKVSETEQFCSEKWELKFFDRSFDSEYIVLSF